MLECKLASKPTPKHQSNYMSLSSISLPIHFLLPQQSRYKSSTVVLHLPIPSTITYNTITLDPFIFSCCTISTVFMCTFSPLIKASVQLKCLICNLPHFTCNYFIVYRYQISEFQFLFPVYYIHTHTHENCKYIKNSLRIFNCYIILFVYHA